MRRASRSIGVATALALVASSALALGFGRLHNATVLGQALDFSVPLRFEAGEFVSAECVTVDVLSGDNKLAPGSVRVSLDASGNPEAPLLHLRSSSLIDEPIVTIMVGVGCPVRLTRTFVALIDPPLVNLAQAPSTPSAASASADAASAPPSDVVAESPPPRRAAPSAPGAAGEGAAPRRVHRPRAVVRAPVGRSAPAVPRRSAEGARPRIVAKAASGSGSRLRLDAPNLPLRASAPAASAPAVAAASAAASAASIDVAAAAPAQPAAAASQAIAADAGQAAERERLRTLEDSLTRLKADSERMQGNVAALQARLREAESGRYASTLVYVLMAIVAGLAFALAGVLWWARQRERERAAWWAAAAERAAGSVAAAPPAPSAAAPAPEESAAARGWRHTVEIPELDTGDVPRRAVSAEELIDLEQQADFFLTLGQDQAAVDLLLNHIASVGGISPLPYLKLLDIHRQRGDREAYERVREHFNQRFNAYAPGFDDRGAPAGSLEDQADVMARLSAAWPTPARAMGVLEPLLFRQDARDAVFDLAAYREVLFLYEVARDLADHDNRPTGAVDFELPLAEEGQRASVVSYPVHTTVPIPPGTAAAVRPLHLDLDLGPDAEPEPPNERSERYEGADFSFSGPGRLADPKRRR